MPETTADSSTKPITKSPESLPLKLQATRPLVKKIDSVQKGSPMKTIVIALLIILVGIASGYGLNTVSGSGIGGLKSTSKATEEGIKVGDIIGSDDEKRYPDSEEGVLVTGGVNGEGTHHLLRPGGPSQNLYLTSSEVDLNLFEGHKIEVWGQTFAAQTAAWLMDVGRIKVLELNAPKPFEEETPTENPAE